ncbi:unnamed protein product [Acanthoscelides obtectus]|uniref:Uncharacterized protein n=1 Tax=Acanthoscelides obtectus TaxID=200917 RepID=A0A9P0JN47_ACAOB|nr:unnamed protein product [Acanthoscelides obtectus]CAK1672379.1 hypothetical protein AOBTE_LOCUS28839 [Acanthoscelides obtectus]
MCSVPAFNAQFCYVGSILKMIPYPARTDTGQYRAVYLAKRNRKRGALKIFL